jgi:hypothetical protein
MVLLRQPEHYEPCTLASECVCIILARLSGPASFDAALNLFGELQVLVCLLSRLILCKGNSSMCILSHKVGHYSS